MQLFFLRQISNSHLGEHPLFPSPTATCSKNPPEARTGREGHLRSQSSECGLSWQHPLEDGLTWVFLMPEDTAKLKTVGNRLLTPSSSQRVRTAAGFSSPRAVLSGHNAPGTPQGTEGMKKCSLSKTYWTKPKRGRFDYVTSPMKSLHHLNSRQE